MAAEAPDEALVEAVAAAAGEFEHFRRVALAKKDECEEKMASMRPVCDAMDAALGELKPSDIHDMAALAKPPAKVRLVADAVMVTLAEERGWANAQMLLAQDDTLLKMLRAIGRDGIPADVHDELQRFVNDPAFTPEIIAEAAPNVVAAPLFVRWVRAAAEFGEAGRAFLPHQEALTLAMGDLERAHARFTAAQATAGGRDPTAEGAA